MTTSVALKSLLGAAALTLPLMAFGESNLQTGTTALTATAHVDFRIVIPKVLSLGVAGGDTQVLGAQRVAIFSNSRTVTLAASSASMPAARDNVILSAAARKAISREAACRLPADAPSGVASNTGGMVCTVAMP